MLKPVVKGDVAYLAPCRRRESGVELCGRKLVFIRTTALDSRLRVLLNRTDAGGRVGCCRDHRSPNLSRQKTADAVLNNSSQKVQC